MSRYPQFKMQEGQKGRRYSAWLAAAVICSSAVLSACGGGGGGDSDPTSPKATIGPASEPAAGGAASVNNGNSGAAGSNNGTGVASGSGNNANSGSGTSNPSGSGASSSGSTVTGTSSGTSTPSGTGSGTSAPSGTGSGSGTSTPGGTGSGTGGTTTPPTPVPPSNTVDIAVKLGIGSNVNVPTVSVTICAPGATGASQCATLDNMIVDTASFGVRVVASALGASLVQALPAQTGASSDSTGTTPIAECTLFGSGYTFGSIKRADVTIGAMKAANLPIQIIGDGAFNVPSDCSSRGGTSLSTAAALGANGILGIGPQTQDYPGAVVLVVPATYYTCSTSTSCAGARVPLAQQVTNPVTAFATDNNGTIVQFPAVPASGAPTLAGTLVFGVGTRANNALPASPSIIPLSAVGRLTTTYLGTRYAGSYIDSGSNGLFFPDATIPGLAGNWFTPSAPLALSAGMSSTGSKVVSVPFTIADPTASIASSNSAVPNAGAYTSGVFAWGLPFFFGRNVYTVIGNATVGSVTGPFIAF